MKVKNGFIDIIKFGKHTRERNKRFKSASTAPKSQGKVNLLAQRLHPEIQHLIVDKITEETAQMKTFRLISANSKTIATFQAGQYLALTFEHQGILICRPYSISSSPSEAVSNGYYDITVKEAADPFFSRIALVNWHKGSKIMASAPEGNFTYKPLRDASHLICIGGGSGITPFKPLAMEELKNHRNLKITLFYGFNKFDDEAFGDIFRDLESRFPKRFKYIPVMMKNNSTDSKNSKREDGLITEALIRKYVGDEVSTASFFICGPTGLHNHIEEEIKSFDRASKFIRRENYGGGSQNLDKGKTYQLTVEQWDRSITVPALEGETLVTALERAGLAPPVKCRSGECGWCRSKLVQGKAASDDGLTGLRMADRKFGWIHPCTCYPKSDITIQVPINPQSYLFTG